MNAPIHLEGLPGLQEVVVPKYPPCVYFLCTEHEVLYVGQTTDILARMTSCGGHTVQFRCRDAGVPCYDRLFVLPCEKSDLDDVESAFIRLYRPAFNGNRRRGGALCAPQRDSKRDAAVLARYDVHVRALPPARPSPPARSRAEHKEEVARLFSTRHTRRATRPARRTQRPAVYSGRQSK